MKDQEILLTTKCETNPSAQYEKNMGHKSLTELSHENI